MILVQNSKLINRGIFTAVDAVSKHNSSVVNAVRIIKLTADSS